MNLVYNEFVGLPTMAINALCNTLYGPGGGTRRLHQKIYGGRNRFDVDLKIKTLPGIVPPLSGYFINANDNRLAIAA